MTGWNAENAAGSTGAGVLTLVEGSSFCISLQNGDIFPHHPHGVFHEDTRILSRWCLTVNGRSLEPLAAWAGAPYEGTYIGTIPSANGRADSPLTVERSREVHAGIVEDITIRNYAPQQTDCEVALSVDVDFADLFEVKDGRIHRQWDAAAQERVAVHRGDLGGRAEGHHGGRIWSRHRNRWTQLPHCYPRTWGMEHARDRDAEDGARRIGGASDPRPF
ncbi:hypothetical protein StoSoilA2_19010 [Arthrobacter sp. StoSoilA2]|nr:hypothetical protein StoSoilA2_19010 [Arthrobacter sp. StoSoilA2]